MMRHVYFVWSTTTVVFLLCCRYWYAHAWDSELNCTQYAQHDWDKSYQRPDTLCSLLLRMTSVPFDYPLYIA